MTTKSKITDIKLPILSPENYSEWKIKITSLLKARDLWFIVESVPSDDEREEKDYDRINEEAKTVIYSSLDSKATQAAGICEDAHMLWQKVTGLYEGSRGDITGLAMSRFMEISKTRQETINDFLGRYEIALNNLKATELIVDIALAIYVLSRTLPLNTREGIRIWRIINPRGTIDDLISYIRANYRDEDAKQDANNTAFFAGSKQRSNWRKKDSNHYKGNNNNEQRINNYKGNNRNNYGGNYNKSANSSLPTCTYCKKNGHSWRDCFKLKRDNENKSNNKKEQAHMALERSYHAYSQYFPRNDQEKWVIDSGATSHMTHDPKILMNYTVLPEPIPILTGDGEHTVAEAKGWIFLQGENGPKVLKNVLYVPKLPANLFSVRKALQDGYQINFINEKKVIVEHEGEKIPAHFDGCLFTIGLKILNHRVDRQETIDSALSACALDTWHKRLAHCGMDIIKRMRKENMVDGLDIGTSPYTCEDCIQGKSCRKSHPVRREIRATKDLAILHFDTVDTGVISLGGRRYFVLGTEEYSGYKLIDFVSHKSDITDCVKLMINSVLLNSKRPVACIYSDNGTEFINRDLREWLAERGIIHELSSAYNAEQNGRAEASNKTVINAARTSLVCSGLPKKLWAEACSASVYVLNRLPSVNKPNITRYELYFGEKPNLKNLHEFGEMAYRLIPKPLRTNKLDAVATAYRFVGYTTRWNTYRLYDEEADKVIIDCNVRFMGKLPLPKNPVREDYATIRWESSNYSSRTQQSTIPEQSSSDETYESMTRDQTFDISSLANTSSTTNGTADKQSDRDLINWQETENNEPMSVNDEIHDQVLASQGSPSRAVQQNKSQQATKNTSTRKQTGRISLTGQSETIGQSLQTERQQQQNPTRITRSMTGTLKPIYDLKSLLPPTAPKKSQPNRDMALYSLNDEPQTVKEARESKDWDKWQEAMKEEIQALESNQTWTIVDRPPHTKPIKAKWIFKLKLNADGTIERYKARLVAKGYSQIPEVDYKLTFAPVASMTTVRMLLATAIQYDMKIVQFDIKTAFLYGDLDEELYMECPEYYDAPKGKVCRLIKSLYGLKQAPRQWHKKFDSFLKKFKLIQSEYDKCLYYSLDRKVFLTIYVDDGLIVAESHELAMQLINYLKEYLTVKTMDCKTYLGLEIIRERDLIFISQRQYVERTLEKYGLGDPNAKPASTPEEMTPPNFKDSPKLTDNFPFKELVGCLLYMVTCTRPDIAHAVSVASRTSEPTEQHWACLKRILRYLKGTKDYGLLYRRGHPKLEGYSDADYANDAETRRSTTGYAIYYGKNPIAWKCQRQSIVTLSTTEAEYVAGTELVKKLIPLKAMMVEMKLIKQEPVKVYIDNKSTVNIVNNEQGQERTKHIDVRHKWLNEHHDKGNISVQHLAGTEQRADMLTKPLHPTNFAANRSWFLKLATMLSIILFLVADTTELRLKETQPVYYRSSEVKYVNQLQRIRFKIIIMNPCETYFSNITTKDEINTKLIQDCDRLYNKVVRLDNCQRYNITIRTERSAELKTGPLNTVKDFVKNVPREVAEQLGVVSQNAKTDKSQIPTAEQLNGLEPQALSREKRIVPLIAIVGLIVVSGMQSYTNYKVDVNTSNIKELNKAVNDERKFLQEGYVFLKEVRDTIHATNERFEHIENRLNEIDHNLEQFPKIMALVNKYDSEFREIGEMLSEIDYEAKQRQGSVAVFKLARNNSLLHSQNDQLQLEICEEDVDQPHKHVTFNYQFLMPQINPKVRIMRAESFRFWNLTAPNKYCWMKYAGPRYVMTNTTNSCNQDIQEYWISEKGVSGHPCNKDNQQLDPVQNLFHPDVCRDKHKGDEKDIQTKQFNGFYKIYCFGNKITIDQTTLDCPEYVFDLPISERFTLAGETYDLGEISTIIVNAIEMHINDQVTNQLRMDKVKIYGINTTRLDTSFERLTRLRGAIMGNITLIESPISNWLFDWAKGIGSWIMSLIEGFSMLITVVLAVGAILLLFPVIEIGMIVWRVGYTLFSAIASPIQRLHVRWRTKRIRRINRNRVRRYITGE